MVQMVAVTKKPRVTGLKKNNAISAGGGNLGLSVIIGNGHCLVGICKAHGLQPMGLNFIIYRLLFCIQLLFDM